MQAIREKYASKQATKALKVKQFATNAADATAKRQR